MRFFKILVLALFTALVTALFPSAALAQGFDIPPPPGGTPPPTAAPPAATTPPKGPPPGPRGGGVVTPPKPKQGDCVLGEIDDPTVEGGKRCMTAKEFGDSLTGPIKEKAEKDANEAALSLTLGLSALAWIVALIFCIFFAVRTNRKVEWIRKKVVQTLRWAKQNDARLNLAGAGYPDGPRASDSDEESSESGAD